MLHQLTRAIAPALSLRATFSHWATIRGDLAEAPRRRMLQVQKLQKTS